MLEALDGGFEFVVWMDSDTMVSHPEIALEAAFDLDRSDAHIFIGREYPWWVNVLNGFAFNAGVFALRCTRVSAQFLRACLATFKGNPACAENGRFVSAGRWAGPCYEQGVMNGLLAGAYRGVVAELPLCCVPKLSPIFPFDSMRACLRNATKAHVNFSMESKPKLSFALEVDAIKPTMSGTVTIEGVATVPFSATRKS